MKEQSRRARWLDHDLIHSFLASPTVALAAIVAIGCVSAAALAPVISPQDPFDPAALSLLDAFAPPVWLEGGDASFLLGADDQGRDLLSAILHGARISLAVGVGAIAFAALLGVALGVLAGYLGGWIDALIMRAADVQLTIPGLLIALMVNAVARTALPRDAHDLAAIGVLIFSIGVSDWPQYARVTRGSTLIERDKEYVQAAKVIGIGGLAIMRRHILPNVLTPVVVLATIGLALAIITEATLSFLGVGAPPTTPSLGTLIRVGQDYLYSGEWWIAAFPATALVVLALSVNVLGDWLRDALDPKLR